MDNESCGDDLQGCSEMLHASEAADDCEVVSVGVADSLGTATTDSGNAHVTTTRSIQRRKFSFSKELILIFLQSVRLHDAHLAQHGKKDEVFGKVCATFLSNLPAATWEHLRKPTVKTLRDKFRTLMADRKSSNAHNENASGIAEDVGPIDQLLDDFLLESNEAAEERRREKGEQNAREEALQAAGETIQRNALTRRQTVGDSGSGSCRSTPSKRQRDDDEEGWVELVKEEISSKRAAREKDISLREREMALSEKQFEEDKSDRALQRAQTRATLDLLNALVDKLK